MARQQVPAFNLREIVGHSWVRKGQVDILSSLLRITSVVLATAAVVLKTINTVGESIECLCPPQHSAAQCNYTKAWCRISPVLFIDYDTEIPHDPTQRQNASRQKMDGYPMVPLVLILLAFCLGFPSIMWQECGDGLSKRISVRNVIGDDKRIAEIIINRQALKRVEQGRSRRALSAACLRVLSACGLFVFGKQFGTYETGLLMLTKLVTVCLLSGAFVVLASFMKTDVTWGWTLLYDRLTGESGRPAELSFFPREILCEVKVRQMQNVVTYTVQCVLPINMWNEKVFATLWFWLLFLLLLSIYSYVFWFRSLMFSSSRQSFLHKLFPEGQFGVVVSFGTSRYFEEFSEEFLDPDVLLELRLLVSTYGLRDIQRVAARLWEAYKTRKMQ